MATDKSLKSNKAVVLKDGTTTICAAVEGPQSCSFAECERGQKCPVRGGAIHTGSLVHSCGSGLAAATAVHL